MPTWSSRAGIAGRRAAAGFGVAALAVAGPAAAQAPPPPPPLLGYCAAPFAPPCVGRLREHPDEVAACTPEMDRYVSTVFAYRACLTRETERAVRESNEVIARFRCAQKRGPC